MDKFEWVTLDQFNFKDDYFVRAPLVENPKAPPTEEVSAKGR